MPENKEIEIRSDEVQEILSHVPKWMVMWGSSLVFVLLLMLILISFLIKYPDVIYANAIVTSTNPPVNLLSKANGKLLQFNISEKQKIRANTIIGIISSTAIFNDVKTLQQKIDSIKHFQIDSIITQIIFSDYQLGEIQQSYSAFKKALDDLNAFNKITYHKHKKKTFLNQKAMYMGVYDKVYSQKLILDEEFIIGKKGFNRNQQLYDSLVISASDYDNAKIAYLHKQYDIQGASASLAQITIQISELDKNIIELDLQYLQNKEQLISVFENSLNSLKTAIKEWQNKYLLLADIDGIVSLYDNLQVNQNIVVGQRLLAIISETKQNTYVKIALPIKGSAKVKVKQRVNIKVLNYPSEEYGQLVGVISDISIAPKDSIYFVKVDLPRGLKTTYNKILEFKQEMIGIAEIITEDKSLAMRIFNKFSSITNKFISKSLK